MSQVHELTLVCKLLSWQNIGKYLCSNLKMMTNVICDKHNKTVPYGSAELEKLRETNTTVSTDLIRGGRVEKNSTESW